ncbi:GAF and ANTAR domain-containing protein [Nocardia crassostreae]|uniref:GAF and ANTAR domain-containing protein n=1 Tax=Nocardia crassostreae TaxID=53428 RepID=UPI000AC6F112|nr:GAF and ANTAR domain-containing protein [Nocardia crassostreae]
MGLADLTARLLMDGELGAGLRASTVIVSRIVPGQPMASVVVAQGGRLHAAATNEAAVVTRAELRVRSGPGLESMARARPVATPDIAAENRWADYSAVALAHGIRSLHAEPLTAESKPFGALCLYAARPYAFDDSTSPSVRLLAAHLGAILAARLEALRTAEAADQLRRALTTRTVIDQALGGLMARDLCDRAQAFAMLRAESQRRNVKLAVLAAEVVRSFPGSAVVSPGSGAWN